MFAYWQFITFALARSLHGTSNAGSSAFRDTVLLTGQLGAFYNAVAFFGALALIPLARRFGAVGVHAACLSASGLAMLCIPHVDQVHLLYVTMIGIGLGWAGMMGNPYIMLVDMIPKGQTGIYMGIFNMFIVIPMIIESLSIPLLYKGIFLEDPRLVLTLAGTFMLLAAGFTLRLRKSVPSVANST